MGRGKNALIKTYRLKATELIDFLIELLQFGNNNQNLTNRNPRLTQVLEYLEQHYTEKIYYTDVCEYMAMSISTLRRFLKKTTGQSFASLIQSIRIKHAKELLNTTTDSICSIGYSVGFDSPNEFCRIFKREMGVTPLSFRGDS